MIKNSFFATQYYFHDILRWTDMASPFSSCSNQTSQPVRVQRGVARIPDQFVRQMLDQAVPRVFMITSVDLWSGTRGRRRVAFARQVAMYLAHVACGLTLTEVGHVFARDRTTVAHACGVIEDLRDDPSFDRSLELLESVLRVLAPPPAPFQVIC
jgi:Bacterial dnaA protein helix-turn-helix